MRNLPLPAACIALALLAGCGGAPAPAPAAPLADPHAGHDHGPASIPLPGAVQRNLGITWAKAEYRVVQGVLRMPGRFESEPSARRPYQAPLAGRVEPLVRPFHRVEAGAPLYRLHAEGWQRLQQELADTAAAVRAADEELAAERERLAALEEALALWTDRLAVLDRLGAELGGQAAERAEAATRVADLRVARADARRALAAAQRQAVGEDGHPGCGQAHLRHRLLLARAAALTGLEPAALEATDRHGVPAWAALEAIEVRAAGPGVVEGEVPPGGAWMGEHATVLTVTDPSGVRLRAAGLQADLPRLRDGLPARIVGADPAAGGSLAASLVIGPMAGAADRSVDLVARPSASAALPAWVRPGVAANLEVVVSGQADEELAIPVAATIRDGLKTVYFRRDPRDPERVARVEADLGASDGRWVAVLSGLAEGDQVVLGGIYPLRLSQQEGGTQAGHFDPDGTFHTGKH